MSDTRVSVSVFQWPCAMTACSDALSLRSNVLVDFLALGLGKAQKDVVREPAFAGGLLNDWVIDTKVARGFYSTSRSSKP